MACPFSRLAFTVGMANFSARDERTHFPMKNLKTFQTVALLMICAVAVVVCGCQEKPAAKPVYEKTKSSAQEAGDAIADAAKKTGVAVGDAAEKTWDGMKKGAQEVSHVATNVASEVKTGAQTVGEKVKDVFK